MSNVILFRRILFYFEFSGFHLHFRREMVRVLFIHPDLGIGGAERLVVDAALALKRRGHSVRFLTNHHDPNHCFEETRNGELEVETVGDWLPRSVFQKFTAFWAYFRMVWASLYAAFILSRKEQIDVIFVDAISVGVPILKWAAGSPKILFYCHFPDLLMAPQAGSALRQLYRRPINFVEEYTTGRADVILVNSKFTCGVFKRTFKSLQVTPDVLYPSLNTKTFDETVASEEDASRLDLADTAIVYLSINRFERKKNITLALKAFKQLEQQLSKSEWERCHLILAGGYDLRVVENVEYFNELTQLADELKLSTKCSFLRSPNDRFKHWLLQRCDALLYTPSNEHFGIVPLEAMYMRKPVIACNSGGPTETVIHESTGFLCEPREEEFAKAMAKFVSGDRTLSESMGEKGWKHVKQHFSFEAFTEKLVYIVGQLVPTADTKKTD